MDAFGKRGQSGRGALAAEAARVARERLGRGSESSPSRVELAAVTALQRNADEAIAWLERAHDAGYRDHGFRERDPILRPLLGLGPRFVEILDRMRCAVDAQRERARQRGLLDLSGVQVVPQRGG